MMYRDYNHFAEDMRNQLKKSKRQNERIKNLFVSGRINELQARYAEQLVIFNFVLREAIGLAQLNEMARCAESFAEAKIVLDGIAVCAMRQNNRKIYDAARERYKSSLNLVFPEDRN